MPDAAWRHLHEPGESAGHFGFEELRQQTDAALARFSVLGHIVGGRRPRVRDDRRAGRVSARGPSLTVMRAVQITRFGGPEVLDVVDVPEPTPGNGQQLYDVSTAGINFADTPQP
jgi:hypothetical protein